MVINWPTCIGIIVMALFLTSLLVIMILTAFIIKHHIRRSQISKRTQKLQVWIIKLVGETNYHFLQFQLFYALMVQVKFINVDQKISDNRFSEYGDIFHLVHRTHGRIHFTDFQCIVWRVSRFKHIFVMNNNFRFGNYICVLMSIYAMINPWLIIYIIRDYREYCIRKLYDNILDFFECKFQAYCITTQFI